MRKKGNIITYHSTIQEQLFASLKYSDHFKSTKNVLPKMPLGTPAPHLGHLACLPN
jgi:hypothetical protein